MATWSNAQQTFGDGTPQTGEQFDNSATLRESGFQPGVGGARIAGGPVPQPPVTARPTPNTAASSAQLAGLDQRLATEVDQLGAGGRRLDGRTSTRSGNGWSTPPPMSLRVSRRRDEDGDRAEGPQLSFRRSCGSPMPTPMRSAGGSAPGTANSRRLATRGSRPRRARGRSTATGDEQMGPIAAGAAGQGGRREDPRRTATRRRPRASRRFSGTIKPYQELSPEQSAYLNEMQSQQHGMSVEDLKSRRGPARRQGTRHRRLVAADEQRRRPEVGGQVRRAAEGRLRPAAAERPGRRQVTGTVFGDQADAGHCRRSSRTAIRSFRRVPNSTAR